MKKTLLIFAVIMLIGTGYLFANEESSEGSRAGSSYIKPTYNVGFTTGSFEGESNTLTSLMLDVDFVISNGLTFGLQNAMSWKSGVGLYNLINFGIGYTYNADGWSAGGKLMSVPNEFLDGGMGFDFNGTYWFVENLGVTGGMNVFFGLGEFSWTFFGLRVGLSAKLGMK